jgi:hypothetical protein
MVTALLISSCSKVIVENKTTATSSDTAKTADIESATVSNQSPETVQSVPSSNPRDTVFLDGKNYIKKSGWKVPSRKNIYIDDSPYQVIVTGKTKAGHEVKMSTIHYIYRTPWIYSEDFYWGGQDLEYLKGKLKSDNFSEMSANGKVFMYSINVEKIVPPPASNSDPHEDPFMYRIQDRNGDGIFETLLGEDFIVPNWVLR